MALANEAFSPTPEQLAWAMRIRTLIEGTTQAGDGAVADDGVLVDMAHAKIAESLLARQRRIEARG